VINVDIPLDRLRLSNVASRGDLLALLGKIIERLREMP
jgi:hypothetical protein